MHIKTPDDWSQLYKNHLTRVMSLYGGGLAELGLDGVVIAAGQPLPIFLTDQHYPFKANPHFKYWLPLGQAPGSFVVWRLGHKPELVIHQPEDFWEKPGFDLNGFWTDTWRVTVAGTMEDVFASVRGLAPRRSVFLGEASAFDKLGLPAVDMLNPPALMYHVHYHRGVKTTYEMACLREATRRGVAGHVAAKRSFDEGGSEYDIHIAYLAATGHLEAELPYTSIIGLNENGACLHYRQKSPVRFPEAERRSMVIDAGAGHNGYISDITRSYAARPGVFHDLVLALDAAQHTVVGEVKPGVSYEALNERAHHEIARILAEFEIVRLNPEMIVERGISGVFLPHGLGHFIGIQVHDVGGHMANAQGTPKPAPAKYPALRLTRTLEAGHAMTIEPGIYFIDMLLDKLLASPNGQYVNRAALDEFRPYGGIRIEDNIILHEGGVENMTRAAFAAKV